MRSRAVSFPLACCLSMAFCEAAWTAASFTSRRWRILSLVVSKPLLLLVMMSGRAEQSRDAGGSRRARCTHAVGTKAPERSTPGATVV